VGSLAGCWGFASQRVSCPHSFGFETVVQELRVGRDAGATAENRVKEKNDASSCGNSKKNIE
jgi:hypothetical protein